MKTKVSVIIPVYNAQKDIVKCLESLNNQSYSNYEIIVVNNNSSDRTKEIICKMKNKNNRIVVVFEPKLSIGASRNTGEKKAKGEIICMTDADCILPANWIEEIIKPIREKGYDAAQGFEDESNKCYWSRQTQIRNQEKWELNDKNEIIGMIDTKNFAIRKKVLQKIGYTSRRYGNCNDTELSIRMQKNKVKTKLLREANVLHRNEESIVGVAKKYVNRGYWTAKVSKDYKKTLQETDFFYKTNQTLWSFIKIIPGALKNLFVKGIKYAYFDTVTG